MVSGKGRVTLHPPTNSLVVTAGRETIQQVREVLGRLDQPVQQVRVRVRFEEERLEQGQAVSGDVTASGDDWKVTTGRRQEDGVDIRLQDQSRRESQTADTVVTVMSGTEAYISVGEDLPVSNRWHRLCRRYGAGCDDPGFRHMETGFQVIPILREGYAVLQITPLISGMGTRPGSVKFTEASTTVRVPLQEWVRIGGSDQNANEVIREILSVGRREQGSSVSLWLKVEPYM
jgi:rRNA processing protein Gar1